MIACSASLRGRSIRILLASAALTAAVALAGCDFEGVQISEKHLQPIPADTLALMERKGMTKEAPMLIRVFKEESELEIWKQDASGQFALLKTYPICRWSGELGPKIKQGDRQAPEGFYTITPAQMNPNSQYYLSFNIGYPNAYDRAWGRTGAHLMVHGNCSSAGCYSMTDEQIGEIFALGREAFFGGQKSFQVQAYPFHMTPLNMARHRNSPHFAFWKMLKEGNDHFEATRQQPKVDVCERRYVFNATEPANMSTPLKFDAAEKCPAYHVPQEIATDVTAKRKRDEAQFAQLVSRGTPTAPVKTGQDGGMHPIFVAKLNPQQVRDDKGNVRWIVDNPPVGTVAAMTPISPARDPANEIVPLVPAAEPAPTITAYADVPMPRPAPRPSLMTAAADGKREQSASLFQGLFSSGDTSESSIGRAASSVARAFGFAREEKQAVQGAPSAAPAPRPVQTAHQQPKPHNGNVQQAQKSEPRRQTAEATVPAMPEASSAGLMSGAQPVMPVGSFENRWPAQSR